MINFDCQHKRQILSLSSSLVHIHMAGGLASSVVAGAHHACALLNNTSIGCWGFNAYGQLGVESTVNIGSAPNQMGRNLKSAGLPAGDENESLGGLVTRVSSPAGRETTRPDRNKNVTLAGCLISEAFVFYWQSLTKEGDAAAIIVRSRPCSSLQAMLESSRLSDLLCVDAENRFSGRGRRRR